MTRARDRTEAGMATVELAVALPALIAVLALALGTIRLGLDRLRCEEAAYQGVRALARGLPAADARAVVSRRAPSGSQISVSVRADLVLVTVTAPVPPILSALPADLRATATLTGVTERVGDPGG